MLARCPGRVERAAEPRHDHAADQPRVAEADLGLRRVDVDVDEVGRRVEEQRDDRVAVARQQVEIRAADRADEQPVADRAAVDEQELMVGHAAAERRHAGEAAEAQLVAVEVDRHGIVGEVAPEQRGEAAGQPGGDIGPEQPPPAVAQVEGDVRRRHRQAADDVEARGELGAFGLEELAACRHLRETVPRP